jgi:diguanylate cyclase (GGDEF)-like protein
LEAGHAIAIAEIAPGRPDDPTGLSPRAFIAAPLVVGGIRWGTVAFLTTRPRVEKFAAGDRDFVRLFGVFVEGALERLNQERRLDALAFSDALTGLPNRLLLDDRLSQTIASAQRHGTSFALHFYDLDGFKSINDRHGHLRGDEVLRAVAHRMERTARQEDTVARIGGDEFVVLQPTIHGVSDAERLAERVRHAISDEPFFVDGRDHRLTASAGIAVYPDHGSEPAALLAAADAALYRVKASGRDAVALATRTPESRS